MKEFFLARDQLGSKMSAGHEDHGQVFMRLLLISTFTSGLYSKFLPSAVGCSGSSFLLWHGDQGDLMSWLGTGHTGKH